MTPLQAFPRLIPRWLFAGLLLLSALAHAGPDQDFLAARQAYAKGQADRFERHAARIPNDYPLQAYIEYWRLKQNGIDPETMAAFIARRGDSPLSERLRQDLARHHGQLEDWTGFNHWSAGLTKPDAELRCMRLRAEMASGNASNAAEGIRLYRTAQDMPSSCVKLFSDLYARQLLSDTDRLARLRQALEANNLRLARELNAQLPESERAAGELLNEAQRQAAKVIARLHTRRSEREIALYALSELAKTHPGQAAALWETHAAQYGSEEQAHGWGQIGLHAARQLLPEAADYYTRAGLVLNEAQQVWRIRSMLRAGRWAEVYRSIMSLPAAVQEEAAWRYWRARALKALGAPYPANQIFAPLSREFGYYGLLAYEELPARLEARPADHKVTPEAMRDMEAHPGLARALLLRKLELGVDAAREWEWAIKDFSDPQILAAAELARRAAWYDRAILTAERTREIHSLDLRYLTPYRDLAEAYASQHGLDPAWVYGLMRQESRFVDYARSGVGAQGLMQIMPATARWIARQLGLGRHAHKQMNQPDSNIRFGTYYLSRIQGDLHGSPVLATAAYNAGPGRARRWQAETPLEGAIYVESIPFSETRDYVKKVLANAMYYSQRLGLPAGSLKDRLGEVPARPGRAPEADSDT
jgi:soluble lytic murein transglycosylase